MEAFMKFIQELKDHKNEYGSLPFWSWNDKLDPKMLRKQIQNMHELGMNGFFMHARSGLETDYLSEEWYTAIKESIDEANRLGMEPWSYDENGWPSGFAGGKLLEDPNNHAKFLKMELLEEIDENALAVYTIIDNKLSVIYSADPGTADPGTDPDKTAKTDGAEKNIDLGTDPDNAAPDKTCLDKSSGKALCKTGAETPEKCSRHCENSETAPGKYYTIYKHSDPTYVDTMSAEVIRKFIDATHEDYKNKLGDDFGGKRMPGFFTDEPQYYRYATAWSDTLPEKFRQKYGYSIYSGLAAMFVDFDGADEFRYDYWKLCHELFIENFIKQIYDWCEQNNCRLTGHAVEETFLGGQMWCCGGAMPFYEYEHIPGIDHLGRNYDLGVASKQLGSVAAQLGKKKALSEMFGCCGWDVTPLELKKIAESQYVAGVNIMCQHLYPYSERGQRKRDYPAHYSEHLPWQPQMKHFNEYFNRLGYTLSRGKEIAPVLVIHPMHSCWMKYKRETDCADMAALEESIRNTAAALYDRHIGFHFGDEEIMARYGRVEGGKLIVGQQEYSGVVIPKLYTLDRSTVKLLKKFRDAGGQFVLLDRRPVNIDGRLAEDELAFLTSTTDIDTLAAESELRVSTKVHDVRAMLRRTERGRIAYVVNLTGDTLKNVRVGLKNATHLNRLDLEDGIFRQVRAENCPNCGALRTELDLAPGESVVITEFEGEDELPAVMSGERITFAKPFSCVYRPQNMMPLDHARVSYDGVTFEQNRPIELVRDILYRTRYAGKLWLKFEFEINKIPDELNLAVEPMNIESICVNSVPVSPSGSGWFDPSFLTAPVTSLLKRGVNDITIKIDYFQRDYVYYVLYGGVSETLRNCLLFDTEIETIYLYGCFGIDTSAGRFEEGPRNSDIYYGPLPVVAAPDTLDMANIQRSGYPFFAGAIEFENTLDFKPGDPTELWLNGRYCVAEITVNGNFVKALMFGDHVDLAGYLVPGSNSIRVRLINSNRNLMGPHHGTDPEPYALGPVQFSYEKQWDENGNCGWYNERYALVKFGAV